MDIRNKKYYEIAREGSADKTHPSYFLISKYGSSAGKILDLGCGEGTRLNQIPNVKAIKIGVDSSKTAIEIAQKQYPSIKFTKTGGTLPFPDNYFDFVYSAFVLEHTENPSEFLKEAVRVLSPGGILLLTAPNFGSPNRSSPNGTGSRIKKFSGGFIKDIILASMSKINNLNWKRVTPREEYTVIDADTTVEPYLLTLEKFLKNNGIGKIKASSLWDQEDKFSIIQMPFKLLGILGIYPFSYWGPQLLFIGKKI